MGFFQFRLIDVIDIVLVAFLMFKLFKVMKGTMALNIFIGLFAFVLFWLTVKSLNMELTSGILDNFVNVGVLALIIVFNQEIRRFLMFVGSRYNISKNLSLDKMMDDDSQALFRLSIKPVVRACENLSKTKTGALIVVSNNSELLDFVQTGELINGVISNLLLESIFYKNSTLHDGAVIISRNKIRAAGCILPVSQTQNLPKQMGLRHRAALGIVEVVDAFAIAVSEETGKISCFKPGIMKYDITSHELEKMLEAL